MSYAIAQDKYHRKLKRLFEPVDFYRPWFRELALFYRHMSREEFWMRYHEERALARALWESNQLAWNRTDYYILRQAYYHRNTCYHNISSYLPKNGMLLEYGCGIAPVSAWMRKRRSDVVCGIADIECRARDYAYWRLPYILRENLNPSYTYDVVVCSEVMEHVPEPIKTIKWLIQALEPGGYLFIDYVPDVGNGGVDQRMFALPLLYDVLQEIKPIHTGGIFRKPL